MWMDSDATTFRVRGNDYLTTNRKCASAPALFKFIGIDLFETPDAHKNMCAHPRNRVNLAHQRGENAWVFVLNIMVPGTPYLNFVCYFLGDRVRTVFEYTNFYGLRADCPDDHSLSFFLLYLVRDRAGHAVRQDRATLLQRQ
jgi:hypothetical protein